MPVPLLLLPGMNCSPHLWHDVVQELKLDPAGSSRQVTVRSLDRPCLDEQVDGLLDRLPARFAIGGLSLGAIVAMAVRRRAPERVAGLFLVATNARPPTDAQRAAWSGQRERLASGATARDLQQELLPLLLGSDPRPPLVDRTLEMADEEGDETLVAQLALQSTRVDERPALAAATVPCTVVAASADRICPVERQAEIHGLVSGSELVVVDGAPHLVTLSHPRRVAAAAAAWLHRVDG